MIIGFENAGLQLHEILWCIVDILCFCLICDGFFRKKHSKSTLWTLTAAAVLILCYSYTDSLWLQLTVTLVCLTALPFLMYRGRWYQLAVTVLLTWLLIIVSMAAVVLAAALLLDISLTDYMTLFSREQLWTRLSGAFNRKGFGYNSIMLVSRLTALSAAWLLWIIRARRVKWLPLTLLPPAGTLALIGWVLGHSASRSQPTVPNSVYVAFTRLQTGNLSVDQTTASISFHDLLLLLVILNIVVLYLVRLSDQRRAEEQSSMLLSQQLALQGQSIAALEKSYRAQRQATHEFHSHLHILRELLAAQQVDAARDYLDELRESMSTRIFIVNSRHPVVDAVLNLKAQTAAENDIDMQLQVNDLSEVTVPTDMLVVLLSNLLDNAIEACLRCPEDRVIQCSILRENGLFLSVRNTSLPVVITDDAIPTTKEAKHEHGYGIPNIQKILQSLDAEYAFDYSGGWFQFSAQIPEHPAEPMVQ